MQKEQIKGSETKVIIAIGASAGGLEPIKRFLSNFPKQLNQATIIIAQHSGHDQKDMLIDILKRVTTMNLIVAIDGAPLMAHNVYLCPPDSDIIIVDNHIVLQAPANLKYSKPSIDLLFKSLSSNQNTIVFGAIFSGAGKDGANGLKAIKASGGHTFIQKPESAQFSSMPNAALAKKCGALIAEPEDMGKMMLDVWLHNRNSDDRMDTESLNESYIDQICQIMLAKYGTDFSKYKDTTIYRRVEKRIEELKLSSIEQYFKCINSQPTEIVNLYNSLLIGVTVFFRDIEAFNSLQIQLKNLLSVKSEGDIIRIWVIGCSTGEEAYSIAIILHELLQEKINLYAIKILATDIDGKALTIARKGIYAEKQMVSVPKEMLNKYFTTLENRKYKVNKELRDLINFSKHDITINPPFINLDLVSCRNLLIYFQPSLQKEVLSTIHYSLTNNGFLLLGKSESIGKFTGYFSPVDFKNKIFMKKLNDKTLFMRRSSISNVFKSHKTLSEVIKEKTTINDLVKETLINTLDAPYVIVNENADIQEIKGNVRNYLSFSEGPTNLNLFKLLNPELQISAREAFITVLTTNTPCKTKLRRYNLMNIDYYVVINIKPILYKNIEERFFLVLFEELELPEIDIVSYQDQTIAQNARYQQLEHEIAITKKELENYIVELESNSDELQVTNEELQSTNEELQSTNEELHSTNDELQNTNEELERVYNQNNLIASNISVKEKELQHFSYMVSHNIRGPLATIMGIANLLLDKTMDSYQSSHLIEAILTSAKNLDGIIRDLNQILSIKNLGVTSEVIHFSKILDDVKKNLAHNLITNKATINADFSEVDELVSVKNYMNSIFTNLITNSIKYARKDISPIINIKSSKNATGIVLTFEDNSLGIDMVKYGDKVFGLYTRFHKEIAEGTGVGLYLVKVEVEALNGTVELQSQVGKGSVFTIHLNF
jgi:two-component system CheB/CheR fusion protein